MADYNIFLFITILLGIGLIDNYIKFIEKQNYSKIIKILAGNSFEGDENFL